MTAKSAAFKITPLAQRLSEEIRQTGPMSFARFMELALYDPEDGYYAADRVRIGGMGGDFFTSVTSGSVLGRVLAAQFAEIWQRLDSPARIAVTEHGANDGALLRDILEESRLCYPDFFKAIRAQIVEPFVCLRKKQEQTLSGHPVEWLEVLPESREPAAIHFGNELIDAFPVHVVEWDGTKWMERKVIGDAGGFDFLSQPLADKSLQSMLADWPHPPIAPFLAEIRPAAGCWMEAVEGSFDRGAILLADYGWERPDFFAPHRSEGTLRGYSRHRLCRNVLETPGQVDLTAHVDFTALRQAAERLGLSQAGLADQHHFLVGAGEGLLRRLESEAASPQRQKLLGNFAHMIHPETFGRAFKFVCYARGIAATPPLLGFRFPHR